MTPSRSYPLGTRCRFVPGDTELQSIDGIGVSTAWFLRQAGFGTIADVRAGYPRKDQLTQIRHVGPNVAESVLEAAGLSPEYELHIDRANNVGRDRVTDR